jgi:hypothetical protein
MIVYIQIDQCMQKVSAITAIISSAETLQQPSVHILKSLHIAVTDAWHVINNGKTTDSLKDKLQ